MTPEVFAEFLARQGHRVVKTQSCYWYNAQKGFYFYFPYHKLINPRKEELRRILWGERGIGVRFFTAMERIGKSSYLIICSDKNYDLKILDSKSRNQTRRGLENCEIKQMRFQELAKLGSLLNIDTLRRQGRNPRAMDEPRWKLYCQAAGDLDGFEAWGAFREGKLASFLVGFQCEDHFLILHQSAATAHLRAYPNNALVFAVTKIKISQPDVATVFYGPQSLDAPESLDTFKFHMGFHKSAMKQRIIFHPLIRPFVGDMFQKCIRLAVKARPQSDLFRKLEGIVRYYRDAA